MNKFAKKIVEAFHVLFYDNKKQTWERTYWRGIKSRKCPLDLWMYQQIIFEKKPEVIIETGTDIGGTALYFADLLDIIGKGKVITIDLNIKSRKPVKYHNRIHRIKGCSVNDFDKVKELAQGKSCMVVLDSNHGKKHVLNELKLYSELVGEGQYLIVEDTNINGNPVSEDHGPGPYEAVHEFLEERDDFKIDKAREKYYLSFNPDGYLLKTTNV